jgi:hypothetical protein
MKSELLHKRGNSPLTALTAKLGNGIFLLYFQALSVNPGQASCLGGTLTLITFFSLDSSSQCLRLEPHQFADLNRTALAPSP